MLAKILLVITIAMLLLGAIGISQADNSYRPDTSDNHKVQPNITGDNYRPEYRHSPKDGDVFEGNVTRINIRQNEFNININRSSYVVTAAKYAVMYHRNYSVDISDIRVGDRVQVIGNMGGSRRINASEIRILNIDDRYPKYGNRHDGRSETIDGEIIKTASRFNRTIIVRSRGDEITVDVKNGAEVLKDGQNISMHSLAVGETVKVLGTWSGSTLTSDRIEVKRYGNQTYKNDERSGKSYRP